MFKFKIAILSLLVFTSTVHVFAQKENQPSVVALQVGAGLAGSLRVPGDSVFYNSKVKGLESTSKRSPVTMLSYDYLVTPRFSVGGLVGYQNLHVSTVDSNKVLYEEGNIHRIYLGFRGNWHYSKNEKIDLYSGFKFGTIMFSPGKIDNNHVGESELETQNNRRRMAVGFIPIGARFFVSDNLGINVETSWGSPAFVCFGVNFRW